MRLPVSQPGEMFVAMMQVQMELGETMKSYRIGFPGQLEASVKSAKNALIVYELQQTVDGQLLSEAVNKAMKLHPLFQSRLVRKAGLEPARLAALEPKSSASTSSATFATRRL